MAGQTSILEDSKFDADNVELGLHADLFALRNLVLSADQAMAHGYRLNDVSLCEERTLARMISHRFKTENNFHLIAFV